jgi:hypothetical protein
MHFPSSLRKVDLSSLSGLIGGWGCLITILCSWRKHEMTGVRNIVFHPNENRDDTRFTSSAKTKLQGIFSLFHAEIERVLGNIAVIF